MRPVKDYRVIFFDMDGTLIDSLSDISTATNHTLRKLGLGPLSDEVVRLFVGSGLNALIVATFKEEGIRFSPKTLRVARRHFEKFYWRHCTDKTRWYPHVVTTLRRLSRRRRLVVFTNKPELFAKKILLALKGNRFFEEVIASIGGEPRKPDPIAALELLKKWKVPLSEALLVGDSLIDWETARRGRFHFALVDHGFSRLSGSDRKKIRYRFTNFNQLHRWLTSTRGRCSLN